MTFVSLAVLNLTYSLGTPVSTKMKPAISSSILIKKDIGIHLSTDDPNIYMDINRVEKEHDHQIRLSRTIKLY